MGVSLFGRETRAVGEAMARRVGDGAVWLSTAGAGVPWLHVRLDDRPKYTGTGRTGGVPDRAVPDPGGGGDGGSTRLRLRSNGHPRSSPAGAVAGLRPADPRRGRARGIRRPMKVLAVCLVVVVALAFCIGYASVPPWVKWTIGGLGPAGVGVILHVVPTIRGRTG